MERVSVKTVMRAGIKVFKFGGTCMAGAEGRVAAVRHCRKAVSEGAGLVVVVSAMGRRGDPYSTDTLISLAPGSKPPELDQLLCCGEIISSAVMADNLRSGGVEALAMTGWNAGIATCGAAGDSDIESIDTGPILDCLERGVTPVIAGFQGAGRDGRAATLGRGGSDTTALALAAALGAEEAVLFKSVDSICSADPVLVPGAFRIDRISSEDLRQMSWQGAGIVHPRAAEIAGEAGIPVEIRQHSTGETVTRIEPFAIRGGKYITGVAAGPVACRVRVSLHGQGSLRAFYAGVFGMIADAGISMDMFSVMDGTAVFTVPAGHSDKVRGVLFPEVFEVDTIEPCSKVSIVGAGMHGMKGVMARFSRALDRAGIDMLQTVDSHATISALVRLEERDRALRALHGEFLEG